MIYIRDNVHLRREPVDTNKDESMFVCLFVCGYDRYALTALSVSVEFHPIPLISII